VGGDVLAIRHLPDGAAWVRVDGVAMLVGIGFISDKKIGLG